MHRSETDCQRERAVRPSHQPVSDSFSGWLPEARFHDLRHSFAVNSLQAGDNPKTVQENLGHATAAFTLDVYAHATERMKRDSANRMEALFQSTKKAASSL